MPRKMTSRVTGRSKDLMRRNSRAAYRHTQTNCLAMYTEGTPMVTTHVNGRHACTPLRRVQEGVLASTRYVYHSSSTRHRDIWTLLTTCASHWRYKWPALNGNKGSNSPCCLRNGVTRHVRNLRAVNCNECARGVVRLEPNKPIESFRPGRRKCLRRTLQHVVVDDPRGRECGEKHKKNSRAG
ncbi:hypothetical protein BC834DRAFT_533103 [Gloeopeniophorella convolvens]|nr:hypothetical protein BC834DRAFT_533103 [Gloeopeniophorella convolvens]